MAVSSNTSGTRQVIHSSGRNPGTTFDLDIVEAIMINRSAVERRAVILAKKRSVKKEWQAAWLLKAVTCIDLTTLSGDDTSGNVIRLCAKARQPIRKEMMTALGMSDTPLKVGAVCVYHNLIRTAKQALEGSNIPIAVVSTGFPAGQITQGQKLNQIRASVRAGAREVDIVISRAKVLTGDWKGLYHEVSAFREACGPAYMKTILATGELSTLTNVAKASYVCMMAGADFIKTSTGKESINATIPVGLVMVRAIRKYMEATGHQVGFKPAGGIRTAKQALEWLILIKEELGDHWLTSKWLRFGASGLLTDIERQLEHYLTGNYSASYRHPLS